MLLKCNYYLNLSSIILIMLRNLPLIDSFGSITDRG